MEKLKSNIKKLIRKVFFYPNYNKLIAINHYGCKLYTPKTSTGLKLKYGLYEKNEFKFLMKELKSSDICIDIGANIGAYSLFFAKNCRKVISFEPISFNCKLLELSANLNFLENIKLKNVSISDFDGECEFLVANETGLSGIISEDIHKHKNYLKKTYNDFIKKIIITKSKTLDSFKFKKVDVIKIDVEGAELKVIKGAFQTLLRCKPRLLMIECEDKSLKLYKNSLEELINQLKDLNYHPHILINDKLKSFNFENNAENLFFIPNI